jgi:periplasmic divalent cation tolerance protein
MPFASVYVTCPDRETARALARELLERRLVACANLVPIESMYHWEGRIEEAGEVAMFLKTRRERVPDVVRAVEALHPYEVPCVVAFELGEGSPAYFRWVEDETARPRPLEPGG